MKYRKFCLYLLVAIAIFFESCQIQNVAGPYQPAKNKISVGELETIGESEDYIPPVLDDVFVDQGQSLHAHDNNIVEEPEQPIIINDIDKEGETKVSSVHNGVENIEEETRAENFVVLEGQEKVELKKYHVVIGSFGNKNNAYRLQSQMKPEYEPILVVNEKGMLRVLLASYDTYIEAKTKINAIRDQFPDAWILIPKSK